MRLLGKPKLHDLMRLHPSSKTWASGWASEIGSASWKRAADIRSQFPRVRETGLGCFAFPVAELPVDVVVAVAFPQGVAVIQEFINRDDSYGR